MSKQASVLPLFVVCVILYWLIENVPMPVLLGMGLLLAAAMAAIYRQQRKGF